MEFGGDGHGIVCRSCGGFEFTRQSDGYNYCIECNTQDDGAVATGCDTEVDNHYSFSRTRSALPAVKFDPLATQSQLLSAPTLGPESPNKANDDGSEPEPPRDIGSTFSVFYDEVRLRYMSGLQLMMQYQCDALVKECGANQMVSQICAPIWFRFVAGKRVFDVGWADKITNYSEAQTQGDIEKKKANRFKVEPRNVCGKRLVMIWYRSLKRQIPLHSSLAISFLACHLAREPILSTDIVNWSIEGKLPYLSAFTEIEKELPKPCTVCPLSYRIMFRPSELVSSQQLESMAASIAQEIGLVLPPVNFYGIASRYLNELSLPEEKFISWACLIQEWSMLPDLWLSANERRLPPRVFVMAILIVVIRIIYNINGFGVWEKSLSEESFSRKSDQDVEEPDVFDTKKLLQKLHSLYYEINHTREYSKDLPNYLQYCKDVIFAGMESPFEDLEEEKAIQQLWEFYMKNKDLEEIADGDHRSPEDKNGKRPRDGDKCGSSREQNKRVHDENPTDSDQHSESLMMNQSLDSVDRNYPKKQGERVIRRFKLDMEEHRFVYIPPRSMVKRLDYLHYRRKVDDGVFAFVAHADYYIVLRACAKVAQIDVRLMHMAVLIFEKRLAWLEKRVEHCLRVKVPNVSCEYCSHGRQDDDDDYVDEIDLSKLSL